MSWGIEFRKNIWAKKLMKLGGIKLKSSGQIPDGPHLIVCNHRSSIDPLINLADVLCYPIAKIEFKSWPIIGPGANNSGVVFVDRSNKESRAQTRVAIAETLQKGINVLIYPEGRTHDDDFTRTFRKGSFEVAAEYGFPILPVAIEYKARADNWDHTDNFFIHFLKNFGKRYSYVELRYGPPMHSDNSWTLMRQARAWIDAQIEDMRSTHDGPDWQKRDRVKESKPLSSFS